MRWWFAAVCLLLVGCRSADRLTEVPVYVHDTAYLVKVERDSTFVDRWHTEYVNGDTVRVRDSVVVVRWLVRTDTAYKVIERPIEVVRTDTIEIEKPLRWWQKGLMWAGVVGIFTVVVWFFVPRLRR